VTRAISEVRRFFTGRGLMNTPGAAAVSGGADSVALLRALFETDVGPIRVVHFDHGVRGADADSDAAFVGELAARLNLPYHRFDAGPATLAGDNFEAVARAWRYRVLGEVADQYLLRWVATGHTADDQAETVLHRLIRGSGIQGLRGIAPVKPHDPPVASGGYSVLVRPLLGVTRSDVLQYLATLDQPYRIDATNADPRLTRNRIRHDLLPLLKTFNPDVVAALNQTAAQAEEVFGHLTEEAEDLLRRAELPRAGEILVFDKPTLEAASPLRVRDLFRLVYDREGWPTGAMTHTHWKRLAALTIADYPDGVSLDVRGKVVQLSRHT
jgi:tRNA(Ile)-lysidine synthase